MEKCITVQVTGRSKRLSFDEAFADAWKQLPEPSVTDGMKRLKVVEIGGLDGGFANFHELYVKVEATIDSTGDRLCNFLIELAIDARRVQEFQTDSERMMRDAGLTESDMALLRSGDAERIRQALEEKGCGEKGLCMALGLLVNRPTR